MAPKNKFTRAEMTAAALGIVRADGAEHLTAKTLAAALGISTQPVFTCFGSMEGVHQAVRDAARQVYDDYITAGLREEIPFFGLGMQYIHFAREELMLYRLLFLAQTPSGGAFAALEHSQALARPSLERIYHLTAAEADRYFRDLWLVVHSLATLIVTGGCPYTDREIGHIHFDSRKIEPGDVFIAQRGVNADGHAFIDKALTRGAVAVVCEQLPENRPEEVTYIWTADTSEALGVMAGNYWDNPSRELKLVGVTGTNGKTTTATLLYELVRLAGEKAGLLSTVCNYIGEEKIPATHTTPDALSIQELLRRMVDAGCRYCFMEASSHAIHQKRIAGLDFDAPSIRFCL